MNFVMNFEEQCEQTVHSLLTVVCEDLGCDGQPAGHFVRAWLYMMLIDTLLARKRFLRAAAVLRHLHQWIMLRAPGCLPFLALTYGFLVVQGLVGACRLQEAAQLAAVFEAPLAVVCGPQHQDVRLLGHTRAGFGFLTGWSLACATCSSRLETPVWCERCRLASYCSESCRSSDTCHSQECITADGVR